ncbi:MAG: malonyl-CoA/methylmalonyl-CoA synthetase [Candidatus Poriferisodalaceae bacterium]|jgi:malonyl-CoA/methylmalonyl-CoA synthetase
MTEWHRHLPADIDPASVDLGAGGTLPAAWAAKWAANRDRRVIHDPAQGWVLAGELLDRSATIAGRLHRAGVSPGDRVILSASSSAGLVCAHAALLRLGAVVMPTNGSYQKSEVTHVVGDATPVAAIVDNVEWHRWLRSVNPDMLIVDVDVELPDGPVPQHLDQVASEAPAMIGYTSGTTGRPKGAVLSHANLLASVRALEIAWRWTPSDRLVLALPLFHMHGLGVGLHGTLTVGASAVLLPSFEPDAVLDAAAEHDATMFFGVPTMYTRLVSSPRARELQRMRLCVSGSAPMPAELHARFEDASGQRVLERYGMTETAMLISNPFELERRAGAVGFPLPGLEVRLEGEPAEIQVRGPNVFSGYWERPDANAEAFVDGWFRTGDLGARDEDGYISIVGRAKELIISGGFNVYPREVEDAILEHEAVRDCAVVGELDPEWGETVVAYVIADRDISSEEMKDFVGLQLAAYKRPRTTYRLDELPRNALGKVQKHRLEPPN